MTAQSATMREGIIPRKIVQISEKNMQKRDIYQVQKEEKENETYKNKHMVLHY